MQIKLYGILVGAKLAPKFYSGAQTFRIGRHQMYCFWPIVCTTWRYISIPLKGILNRYMYDNKFGSVVNKMLLFW
jgi:hypothetical protein